MRIGDCSSYVCSSDLVSRLASVALSSLDTDLGGMRAIVAITASISLAVIVFLRFDGATSICIAPTSSITSIALSRSEEHTSELQSLMRISYAVFCLKKKNQTITRTKDQNTTDTS